MKLGRKGLLLILIALYIGAVWMRFESLSGGVYPYYKGESGTNFRHAYAIAGQGALPTIDPPASWPEGYSPSRVRPNGVEYFTGFAYRLVNPFSDVSEKRFSRVLTVLFSSLSVLTLYALTRKLWACQAAGVFAAFLVAFSGPLIGVTNGKDFLHAPYAFVVISVHLAIFLSYAARPSTIAAVLSGLAVFVLFGMWGGAGLYIAAFGLVVLVLPSLSREARRRILVAHLAAALLAGITLPHLRADRFVLAWPAVWLLVITLYSYFGHKLPRRTPGWIYVLGASIVVALVLRPLQSRGSDVLDPLAYWYYRFRFIAGKPGDPTLLPDAVRVAWTYDHAPPRAWMLVEFFLPLVFLLPSAVGALRALRKETNVSLWVPLASAAIGATVFFIDRRAIFSAALLVLPFVSGAFRGFRAHLGTRVVPAAIAVVLLATTSPLVSSKIDVVRIAGRRLGLFSTSSGEFTWASIGNADRDLVRVLTTRTSTRNDVILAPPEVSPLVAMFAGRATIVSPGVFSRYMARKVVGTLAGFYSDEKDFYARCEALGVTYVVYSIDVLLDGSSYSPRYMSGATASGEKPLAYRMHFAPETLGRFQLVYENDNYRLFRVTADLKPVFLTDHPPVYQEEILRTCAGDLDAFYSRIVDILSTYQTAVAAQGQGDDRGAIWRFMYCLDLGPSFTDARLGMGDSFLRLRKPDQAYTAYSRVLQYSPDDKHALYYGALSLAYTGRKEDALRLIDLLLSATAESEVRSQALELKAALESGRPLEMPRKAARGAPKSVK
jgi:hypothetical protein